MFTLCIILMPSASSLVLQGILLVLVTWLGLVVFAQATQPHSAAHLVPPLTGCAAIDGDTVAPFRVPICPRLCCYSIGWMPRLWSDVPAHARWLLGPPFPSLLRSFRSSVRAGRLCNARRCCSTRACATQGLAIFLPPGSPCICTLYLWQNRKERNTIGVRCFRWGTLFIDAHGPHMVDRCCPTRETTPLLFSTPYPMVSR